MDSFSFPPSITTLPHRAFIHSLLITIPLVCTNLQLSAIFPAIYYSNQVSVNRYMLFKIASPE